MEIKNIFHTAALRVLAFALALIPIMPSWAVVTHTATDPQPKGATVEENLNPITDLSISWDDTFIGKSGDTSDGLEGTTYYDNNTWYSLYARSANKDGYFDWKSSHAISFKLESGKYKLILDYTCNGDARGMWVYPGTTRPKIDGTSSDDTSVGFYEKGKFSGTKELTLSGDGYWTIGGIEGTMYLHSIKLEKIDEGTELADVTPISSDYVWYAVDRAYFGDNQLCDAYSYIQGDFQHNGDNYTLHDKGEKIKINGIEHPVYRTGSGTILGFKVAKGKKGVINVYYLTGSTVGNFPLYEGDKKVTTDQYNVDNAIVAQYFFDTTGGEKTYRLERSNNVWFGGFEVLFDEGNTGGRSVGLEQTYTVTGTDIKNAIGEDTYKVFKSSNPEVFGPSMVLSDTNGDNVGDAVMVYKRKVNNKDERNAILFKIPAESKVLNVKGYLAEGADIRVYKGNEDAPTTEPHFPISGTGATIDVDVPLSTLGSISTNDVIWICSSKTTGAYLTSVTPKNVVYTELQPTNVNYIYKVDGVPSKDNGGVQNSGDTNGRIKFVDSDNTAWSNTNAKMNVLGTTVSPVAIQNGSDYFAVKVDKGPNDVMTGYVKVYFNGGSSASHVMTELPLDDPMNSGSNSSYDPDTHVITFNAGKAARGWWFGTDGAGARNLGKYNKINIQLGKITGNPGLQLVVQSTNGGAAVFDVDLANKRILGDLTDQSKWKPGENGAPFDTTKISQIYLQDWKGDAASTVEITSARLMNKPVVIATGNDENSPANSTEVFGGKIYNLPDGYLYEYPFDLNKATSVPQLIWITGAGAGSLNIAAIEVLYDSNHAKVVEWYVNKDTKMIVGSDDPSFTMEFQGETLKYPAGYDEYVTFYMSSGRQANVSFIMPEAVREVYDWEQAVKAAGLSGSGDLLTETDALAATYGKHTLEVSLKEKKDKNGDNPSKVSFNGDTGHEVKMTYNRDKGQTGKMGKIDGDLYSWYSYSYDLPSAVADYYDRNGKLVEYKNQDFYAGVSVTATQKENGSSTKTEKVKEKDGQWKIYMRFVSFQSPTAINNNNSVSVTKGQGGNIYYTVDSSDPENLGVMSAVESNRSATENYNNSSVDVSGMNCIFKAAEYITTPCYFYDDITKGKDSKILNVMKVVSADLAITNQDDAVVYVKDNNLADEQLFNVQNGGYMLTIPTGKVSEENPGWKGDLYIDKDGKVIGADGKSTETVSKGVVYYYDQPYNANPFMYLTLGGKDHPRWKGGTEFEMCGTNWKASNDGGLKTYLDSYQYKFDVDAVNNPSWWASSGTQNQNPYTECNGGVGGADTENGGMFLQPIAGTMLRFEPEYDGVITVWLRQNGCLDNNTQESGAFSRRPVYVMDENGRVMRRSTIRPTAAHYMGINGVWAINSSVCEERSQVEHTWLHEVAKQVFEDHPLYGDRFGADFPNRWAESGHDHSGHILYGWWYKGFDLNATRSMITSASHVSRFEYMEPELLYRSDNIFNMEMNRLGLENKFSKYGFELPNFQYVQYRIPVKAGKTYYIAGRGTKNGFSAIRFDALKPNTSYYGMEDLRYTDNPEVVENDNSSSADYLKVTSNWNNNGSRDYKGKSKSDYDLTGKTETEVLKAYSNLKEVTISETANNNASTINSHVNDGGKAYGMDSYNLGNLVGKTVDVTLDRTFRAYNWHPIILPFSLSETRVEQYFGEGTVVLYLDPYTHSQHNQLDETTGKSWTSVLNPALDGTKLSFTIHRYQMIYANTPAFICPTFTWSNDMKKNPAYANVKPTVTDGAVSRITFKRVTLDGSNSRNFLSDGTIGYAISNDYEVVGSYDQTTQTGDIYYVNNTDPTGGKDKNMAELVHSENKTVTMKGTRVWIRPRAEAVNPAPIKTVGSRGFSDFEEDSDLSGISDIVADDYTIEGYDIDDDAVYDMMGRLMGRGSLDGLQKGVYIFHGRKVYVR